MLRIESYVTPIILSYVDKYIKNIKADDSQVSLWGGDAVFNNLDLRLDVLEQELKLPFSFVNGHIHELRIHVPWTKLTSEPIVITINTIECILKLKNYGGTDSDSSTVTTENSENKNNEGRKKSKRQAIEAPTSYIQTLINKVINNISIVCNNVILKYVEDDIVLSINAKTLELVSVNQEWAPSFIDLSSEDLMLRNLVSLTDLTVCLDKRNASGRIESYQEPLLYRCSFTCRLVRQFESLYSSLPLNTRYDIFCPQLHFSLSDTQLPMFLRLMELLLALYYKDLQYYPPKTDSDEKPTPGEEAEHSTEDNEENSWSSWAWYLGSSIIPITWEDSEDSAYITHRFRFYSTLHLGIYIETATWVFKLTESSHEGTYFGPTKMVFTPFMKIEQQGSYMTTIVKGMEAVNVQMGISCLSVEPIEECVCGIADSVETVQKLLPDHCYSSLTYNKDFVNCGRESQEYLSNSLFDQKILFGGRELWDYQYIWEQHISSVTEGTLFERTQAFGMDYLYIMEIPADVESEKLSEIYENSEYCNMEQQALCRFVCGPMDINVCSGFFHRIYAIQFALEQYDYSPYPSENADENLSPASTQVLDKEIEVPETAFASRSYSLTCYELNLNFHMAQHSIVVMKQVFNAKKRKKIKKVSEQYSLAHVMPVASLSAKVSRLEVSFVRPMYPKLVIKSATLLRPDSAKILDKCYSHFAAKFHNCAISLLSEDKWPVHLVQGFSYVLHMKNLILPHSWNSTSQLRMELSLETDLLVLSANMPQIILIYHIINSWFLEMPNPEKFHSHSLVDDAIKHAEKFPVLTTTLHSLRMRLGDNLMLNFGGVSTERLSSALCKANKEVICYVFNGPESMSSLEVPSDTASSGSLLKIVFQFPKQLSRENGTSVFSMRLLKMSSIIGPQLFSWVKYSPRPFRKVGGSSEFIFKKILEAKSSSKLNMSSSDGDFDTFRQESSSATASDLKTSSRIAFFGRWNTADVAPTSKTWKEKINEIYPFINNLIISIEIEPSTLFFSTHPINITSDSGLVNAIHRMYLTRGEKTLGDTSVICCPHILLRNSAQKQSHFVDIQDMPISPLTLAWLEVNKNCLPWSLNLSNFHAYSLQGFGESIKLPILKPVNTTATLAVTPKYKGPALNNLGAVIHIDMSPLDFRGSRRQVESHVAIVESLVGIYSFIDSQKENLFHTECKQLPTINKFTKQSYNERPNQLQSDQSQIKPLKSSNVHYIHKPPSLNQRSEGSKLKEKRSSGEAAKKSVSDVTFTNPVTESEEHDASNKVATDCESVYSTSSVFVSTWVQWTVAKVSACLYSQCDGHMKKLRAEIEDLTTSLDLHQIYSKVKCKIASLGVHHYIRRGSEWSEGAHEGIVLTTTDHLTREIQIVSPSDCPLASDDVSVKSLNSELPSMDHSKAHGFLSLTVTVAQCKNIHSKWNQLIKRHLHEDRFIKENNALRFLSEVDVRIQPFDCIFYPKTLQSFISVCDPWLNFQIPKHLLKSSSTLTEKPKPFGLSLNNKVLPLMYVQTEPVRIFLPSKETSIAGASQHDFILVQLDSILVTPQVDNPLSRIVLRQDILSTAEQAKIIGIPGSEVEDRQYQIDFQGFSISTGVWFDLINMKIGRPRSSSSELLGIRGENPALEWNNYDPLADNANKEVVMYPLVVRLDTRIIAAPAIVYESPSDDGTTTDPLVVTGHSLEINATTHIDIFASLAQLELSYNALEELALIFMDTSTDGRRHQISKLSSEILDSGVDCEVSSIELSKGSVIESDKEGDGLMYSLNFIPIEVLITGSKISVCVFDKLFVEGLKGKKVSVKGIHKAKLENRERRREKLMATEMGSTESEQSPYRNKNHLGISDGLKQANIKSKAQLTELEDGYEGSEEECVYETEASMISEPHWRFLPLLYLGVSQPHMFASCQPERQRVDLSCFDFSIKSAAKGGSVRVTELKKLPCLEDYVSYWVETRPGDANWKTGVPPAFFTFSAFDFLHKPAQISLEVGRPFRICLSETKWEQIQHVLSTLESFYTKKLRKSFPSNEQSDQNKLGDEINSEKKHSDNLSELTVWEKLRNNLMQIDSFNLCTSQIHFNIGVNGSVKRESELYALLSKLNLCVSTVRKKFIAVGHDTKDHITEVCIRGTLKDLQIKTSFNTFNIHSMLKPWTLNGELRLLWLQWKSDPYIYFKIESEIMQVDFGPENLFSFLEIWKFMEVFLSQFHSSKDNVPTKIVENFQPDDVYSDAFFQDDLRAGAFQFITDLPRQSQIITPQPYQVIFDKDTGTMVWCYPEPRALIKVDIYPVPFKAASEISTTLNDAVDDDLVLCALQYFDSLRDSFVTYKRFQLSESKFCQLDLPTIHEKKFLAVSNIWRVCINYIEDEVHRSSLKAPFSPEALGACMRVDSFFSVNILPITQVLLILSKVDISLQNHLELNGSKFPSYLAGYSIDGTIPKKQSFVTFTLDSTCFKTYLWTTGSHIDFDTKLSINVLNYKFLVNNLFLEHSDIKFGLYIQEAEGKNKPKCYDGSISSKEMYIHISQSTYHTITMSIECWKQALFILQNWSCGPYSRIGRVDVGVSETSVHQIAQLRSSLPLVIMTSYVITNDTTETIRFGQINTDENILLEAGNAHFYSWRSHKVTPKLQVCIESNKWKWCEAFYIEKEGTWVCSFSHLEEVSTEFLVTCKKINSNQMHVSFSGFFSVANCLHEDIEFRIIENPNKRKTSKPPQSVHLKSQSVSPSLITECNFLKVRLTCSMNWSGKIPISSELGKDSVTVRIPLKTKEESIMILCKVYKEKFGAISRTLILFSPHFVVRSHLPRTLSMFVTTISSNITRKVTIKGRGSCLSLDCDPSHAHQLTFQLNPDLDVSKPPIPINRSLVDQVRQNSPAESFDFSKFTENLFKGPKGKWPYIDSSFIEGDFLFADQPKVDLQISFSSLFPHCNTLVIDVKPWTLIINHTGMEILLQEKNSGDNTWYIPSGVVFAPPKLESFFSFGIVKGEERVFSIPLQLSKEERWYSLTFEGRIPRAGSTNISIRHEDQLFFFTVSSSYEENIQILHLVPTYTIANNTNEALLLRPFYVPLMGEKFESFESVLPLHLSPSLSTSTNLYENPLLFWGILAKKDQFNSKAEAVLCIQIGRNNGYSRSVPLRSLDRDRRITLTLPVSKNGNILNESFILTLHPVNSTIKIVIQKDPLPQMVIYNNTLIAITVGQNFMDEDDDDSVLDVKVDVLSTMPTIPSLKAVFYTFPSLSRKFPDILSQGDEQRKLHLTQPELIKNPNEDGLWSAGIDIYQIYDQFISIPSYGDAKIHIERVGHTSHVYIDPASRVEISARDIRSRIASPQRRLPDSTHAEDYAENKSVEGNAISIQTKDGDKLLGNKVDQEGPQSDEDLRVVYFTLCCSELSFLFKDDVNSCRNVSEIIHISLDNVIVSLRPQLNLSEKLRTLNYRVRDKMELTAFVGDAQIDNQMFSEGNFDFPVILLRQDNSKSIPRISPLDPLDGSIQMSYNNALFTISVVIENSFSEACLDSVDIQIKPLRVYVEDTLMYSLISFINSFFGNDLSKSFSDKIKVEDEDEDLSLKMKLPFDILCKSNAIASPLFISDLRIGSIFILLSIHASIKLFVALDQSPLHFKEYQRVRVLTTGYTLGHNLAIHYLSSALLRAGWVVSSLDLLGNPGGFARTVGSGIRDFVQLPYEGILLGPWAFVAGVTHGSMSLLTHFTAGTLLSVTNLANSVARNMERLSLDEEHLTRNEANRRVRPSGVTYGVVQGLSSLGISILGAVGGLAHQPIQAVLSDGASPFSIVGGFGKGLIGAVTKPIGGAADLVGYTGQGLLHRAGWKQNTQQRSLALNSPFGDASNASLKYVWKLMAALPDDCRHVTCAADATVVTASGAYAPVTVLLTPQMLFIVGVNEDAQEHAFTLHELEWKCHSVDPTLLYLMKSIPPIVYRDEDEESVYICPADHVAEYVKSVCSEVTEGDDLGIDPFEEKQERPRVVLYLSPQFRTFLVSCINMAVRATKGKGFIAG